MVIYKITNLINGKMYIGQTIQTKEKRFLTHLKWSRSPKRKYPIHLALHKYGKENFKVEELEKCFSIIDLNNKEIYWIKKLKSNDRKIGYNLNSGGYGNSGYKHTEKAKLKIKNSCKGKTGYWLGKKLTEEHKQNIGNGQRGKKHWNYGKHWSKKIRNKISNGNKGKKLSKESIEKRTLTRRENGWDKDPTKTNNKRRLSLLGHSCSFETRKKMKEKKKNYIPWNKGMSREEQKLYILRKKYETK